MEVGSNIGECGRCQGHWGQLLTDCENVQKIGTPKERKAQEEENTKDKEVIGHMRIPSWTHDTGIHPLGWYTYMYREGTDPWDWLSKSYSSARY